MIKVLFPICTLTWCVNTYVSRHKNVQKGKPKVLQWIRFDNSVQTVLIIIFQIINSFDCFWLETISSLKKKLHFRCIQEIIWKCKSFLSSLLLNFSPKMVILRNKWKLAAVTRETQEDFVNSRSQNTSVPEITDDYTRHIFEQFDGRVNKRLSQESSWIESASWMVCAN